MFHVDNEIHCMDKILRFYDLKQYQELCDLVHFSGTEDGLIKFVDPFMMSLARCSGDIDKALFLDEEEMDIRYNSDNSSNAFRLTKSDIRRENTLCRQKLKNNRGYQGRIINRNRKDL